MRWCTTSDKEQTKCNAFIAVVNDSNVNSSCVQAASAIQCMEKIQNGDADLVTLDGGEIYRAGNSTKCYCRSSGEASLFSRPFEQGWEGGGA